MEKLQELIAFLKSKGLEHKKIDVDVLCAMIEFFGKESETEQLRIGAVAEPREQLAAFAEWLVEYSMLENHITYKEMADMFLSR